MPSSRAAMTRVSLTTSASPARRKSGRSETREIRQRAVGADDEHSRAVAGRRGLERDPLRREVEIEGVDAHRLSEGARQRQNVDRDDPRIRSVTAVQSLDDRALSSASP